MLGDKPITAAPNCTMFYFRVRKLDENGRARQFDTCLTNHNSLASAYASVKRCYPDCEISVLQETDFDTDGLPRMSVRAHAKVEKSDGRATQL